MLSGLCRPTVSQGCGREPPAVQQEEAAPFHVIVWVTTSEDGTVTLLDMGTGYSSSGRKERKKACIGKDMRAT